MISELTCPNRQVLQDLLDDLLPDEEQAELTAHLDGCPACQQLVETMGSHDSWPGPRKPGPRPILESALRQVMAEMKGTPEATIAPCFEAPGGPMIPDWLADGTPGRFGPYEVSGVIGRGGMGIVLKAFDPTLNRHVAIKVLAPQLASSAAARRRFDREARAAAAVNHDNVVMIHQVQTHEGLPYLVMQYVPGMSLQERINHQGALELQEILRIGMQTAAGLAAAHAQGVIHRDVKPGNILLENGIERVKLTDFGLAQTIDDASLTQSGVLAGTPQYMAPEQARGDRLDSRADLFSLGSVLYTLCTGRPPFRASTAYGVIRRVSDDMPRPVREVNPSIPEWLERIISKLHSKEPDDRFATAAEVADLLGRCLAHIQSPASVPLPPLPEPTNSATAGPPRKRKGWRLALAAAVLAISVLGFSEGFGLTRLTPFAGTIMRFKAAEGTLVVESEDPEVKVTIDGEEIVINGAGVQEVRLRPGTYRINAKKDGAKQFEEIVTVRKDGKEVVKVRLESEPAAEEAKNPGTAGLAELLLLKARTDRITNLVFTPDGKLVTGEADQVKVWDAASGKMLFQLHQPASVARMAVLPVGDAIATYDEQGSVRVWDLESGKEKARHWIRSQEEGDRVFFFRDKLAVGDSTGAITLWGALDGERLAVFRLPDEGGIETFGFSPDGRRLIVRHANNALWSWRVEGQEPVRLRWKFVPTRGFAFSPDGKHIATESHLGIVILDSESGKPLRELTGHSAEVSAVTYSADGKLVASGDAQGQIRIWDTSTGKLLHTLRGHADRVTSLAFSPDGKKLVSGGADRAVRVWDLTAPPPSLKDIERLQRELKQLKEELEGARQESKQQRDQADELKRRAQEAEDRGKERAGAAEDRAAREKRLAAEAIYAGVLAEAQAQWQQKNAKRLEELLQAVPAETRNWEWHYLRNLPAAEPAKLRVHRQAIRAATASPDGKLLATASNDGTICVWDPSSNRKVLFLLQHASPVTAVAFTPDARTLASAAGDGTVKLWDAGTGKEVRSIESQGKSIRDLSYSPDGKVLAIAVEDGTVRLWDPDSGKHLNTLHAAGPVFSIRFSPDGKRLASGSPAEGVILWDWASGKAATIFRSGKGSASAVEPFTENIPCVRFSPNGQLLAVAESDRGVRIWDVEHAEEIARLAGHVGEVTCMAFAPSGQRLFTGSPDGTIRVWDTATWQELLTLKGKGHPVLTLAITPDGQLLLSGGDQTAELWDGSSKDDQHK
jgi:WD40 repeat protein/serine/threonine protein kinase